MSDDNIYNVEKIVDSRIISGKKQYLIKWEGFDDNENTWEKASDILCKDLIDDFERKKKQSKKKKSSKKIDLIISNEWHDDVDFIDSVYQTEKGDVLLCDLVFSNGKTFTVETKDVHVKCPLKLIEYYEKNINFTDSE